MANRQWAFDAEFRALSEGRAAANVKNPVGMVSVKESAEDTGTKVARSNKELLLKVRSAAAGFFAAVFSALRTLTGCARYMSAPQRATELSYSPAKNFMMTGASGAGRTGFC